jgi:hypothetical protein
VTAFCKFVQSRLWPLFLTLRACLYRLGYPSGAVHSWIWGGFSASTFGFHARDSGLAKFGGDAELRSTTSSSTGVIVDTRSVAVSPAGRHETRSSGRWFPDRAVGRHAECDVANRRRLPVACTQVQAGKVENPPKNCVAIEPILAPMVDWPTQCNVTGSSTTPWVALDRRNGCNHTAFFIVVINLANGEELGRSVIHTAMKMIASTTAANWSIPVDVRVASSTTPIGRPTTTTGTFVVCSTNCVASGLSYGAVTTSYWKGSLTLSAKEMIAGSWRDHVGGYWRITFNNPDWVATTSSDLGTADSRCDNFMPQFRGRRAVCSGTFR